MKTTTENTYTLYKAENSFEDFSKFFNQSYHKDSHQNIILDFSDINYSETQIQSLQSYAETQSTNNQSFAIILPKFDADDFEEILNVVPTLTEAIDMIDMDEMTRDLGF